MAAGRVIEPLADLYKVEVRELREKLGIAREAPTATPFQDPVWVCGFCAPTAPSWLLEVGLQTESGTGRIWIVGKRSSNPIGRGESRSSAYEHPVLLEGEGSFDDFVRAAQHVLGRVPDVNRALWNLSGVPAGTIIPQSATMTRERLDLLREADALVMDGLHRHGLYDTIWQCPTAMVPLQINGEGTELVIPVQSFQSGRCLPVQRPCRRPCWTNCV